MDAPTPDELRSHSALLAGKYADDESGNAALTLLASVTSPLVGWITGRSIAGEEGEEVPTAKLPIAVRAIAMKSEKFDAATGTVKAAKRSMNRGNLASFSAGSYSETYFGPEQMIAAKRLDSDPILSELLWALCTPQRQLEWLALWDPADYPTGEGGLMTFEYGDRPNYSPTPLPRP